MDPNHHYHGQAPPPPGPPPPGGAYYGHQPTNAPPAPGFGQPTHQHPQQAYPAYGQPSTGEASQYPNQHSQGSGQTYGQYPSQSPAGASLAYGSPMAGPSAGQQYSQAPYGGHAQPPLGQPPPAQGGPAYQQNQYQYNQQLPYAHQPQPSQYQSQYPPQQYGTHAQAPSVPPTPASWGYDLAQKAWVQPVNTASDIETLRTAMKGMGCDERALIRTLTKPEYANPWAIIQLAQDYNSRFIRHLAKDIESETRGDLETALLALTSGPLENDVRTLEKALNRAGTDEDALNDILLCRSNADLRAISAEYKRVYNKELLLEIREDVDDSLFRMYSMVLAGQRAEDAAPVLPYEIYQKVIQLHQATEGIIGANAISVAQIFTSSNGAQLHAINDAYQRKYHRSLQDVIEKEFRGDMEDALLRMLLHALDRSKSDCDRLTEPLRKTVRKDRLFINRVLTLHWDQPRLEQAKAAYRKKYGRAIGVEVKALLKGDYENLMLILLREK